MLVNACEISRTYTDSMGRKIEAIRDINLQIKRGEFLGFVGPSGSGKSTLLNILGCLERVDQGTLEVDGQRINELHTRHIANFRNATVGFVFQNFNLISALTVRENIELPLLFSRKFGLQWRKQRVDELIEQVDLAAQADQPSNLLSGGQMQRVAIARALVTGPKYILADEPTANLDHENSKRIMDLMRLSAISLVACFT